MKPESATRCLIRYSGSILVLSAMLLFSGCGDESSALDPQEPQPVPSGDYIAVFEGSGSLVGDRKGFRFEGGVRSTEPVSYPYLSVLHMESYNDSTRVVVQNQNEFKSITQGKVVNFHAGHSSRSFKVSVGNNESYQFKFYHPGFLITSVNLKTGNYNETGIVFGKETQTNRSLNWSRSYPWVFMENHIVRAISGISLWPYATLNGGDEPQFVATGELSDPKAVAHHYLDGFPNFPHDLKSNLYSGFFQSTLAGSYVGVSKGSANLDTAYISDWNPDWYLIGSSGAYLDKRGDTLFLGVMIPLAKSNLGKLSLYRLIEGENILTPLYRDIEPPAGGSLVKFRAGRYYVGQAGKYSLLDRDGTLKPLDLPEASSGLTLGFGREKIFGVLYTKDLSSLEIYSRDY